MKAEEILLDKTDLDTSDIENIRNNSIRITPYCSKKKLKTKKYDEIDSDTESDSLPDVPKLAQYSAVTVTKQNAFIAENDAASSSTTYENVEYVQTITTPSISSTVSKAPSDGLECGVDTMSRSQTGGLEMSTLVFSNTQELNNLKQEIIGELKQYIDKKIDELKCFISGGFNEQIDPLNGINFEKNENFPLQSVEQIIEFDNKLKSDKNFSRSFVSLKILISFFN